MENEETSTHFDAMAFVDKAEYRFVAYNAYAYNPYGGMKECVVRFVVTVDSYYLFFYTLRALIVAFLCACERVCVTMPKNMSRHWWCADDSKDDGENDDNGVIAISIYLNTQMYDFFLSPSLSLGAHTFRALTFLLFIDKWFLLCFINTVFNVKNLSYRLTVTHVAVWDCFTSCRRFCVVKFDNIYILLLK